MKNSLLKCCLLFASILSVGFLQAQTVTGTVSDPVGPLPGANVVVKGTSNGTQTDFDGNYTIDNVGSDAVLVFSYVGFETQEVSVNGQSSINVTLQESSNELDEVVVIGYGQTTVKDATGSVASVTAEEFNRGVIASPEQLIQGKTAGVNIQQTSGEPGAGISVSIRGSNSVRSNNNPLFVVDGVPLAGDNVSPGGDAGDGNGTTARNPLNFLNPNDIESISILKDASATAIYGSRGANGVVIITTKTGKGGGGGQWEFTSNLSFAKAQNRYDLLNREQFLSAIERANPGSSATRDKGFNTDWQSFITRPATSTANNLSYSNNYGKGNVRATFSYSKQFGIIEKTDLERITGRVNANHRFFDNKLRLSLSATASRINDETAPLSAGAGFRGDVLGASYTANPTWSSSPGFSDLDGFISPSNYLANSQIITNTNRYLLNASAEYAITDELKAKVNVGFDYSEGENVSVLSADLLNFPGTTGVGQGSFNTLTRENNLLEATLTYDKEFENSKLNAVVGFSYQDFQTRGRNAQARGFQTTELNQMAEDLVNTVNSVQSQIGGDFDQFMYAPNLSNIRVNRIAPSIIGNEEVGFGNSTRQVTGLWADLFDNTNELQSFFARAVYTIQDKYIVTGTIRADGSSRFGPNNRYGYFPSGSVAWKMSEEDFVGESVSTLKLRLGAGVTGNQDGLGFANWAFVQGFPGPGFNGNSQDILVPGFSVFNLENLDLQWEPTFNVNVGLDFGFNNDRFNGSFDVYRNKTSDILLSVPTVSPAILSFRFENIDASLINQGVELSLNYDWVNTEDIGFSTSFNIAYNDNVIDDYNREPQYYSEVNGPGLSQPFSQRLDDGQPLYSYYMAVFEGFDSNGEPIYEDVNGDGVRDPDADKRFIGEDALPDITSGLALDFRYKNWDVNAFFSGQFGFSVYNNTALAFFVGPSLNNARNVTTNVLSETLPANYSTAISDRFLEKGDFVRLQNASIGYNWPLSGEGAFKSLRFSLTGQNLFLITDYSGLDPEVTVQTGTNGTGIPSRGIDWAGFPNPRTFTLGVSATF